MTERVPKIALAPKPAPLTPEQQQLVLDNQGFARKATRFYTRKFRGLVTKDELRQVIQLALVESARTFDPTHGVAFASFAWLRVAGSAHDAARGELAHDPLRGALAACLDLQRGEVQLEDDEPAIAARAEEMAKRLGTAAILGIIGATPVASDATPTSPAESPEARVLAAELRRAIEAAVAALPERPRRLVGLYYGEGRTLRDVSTELEVSYATVRRDHDDAVAAIREECSQAGHDALP